MLNIIWSGFFIASFLVAAYQAFVCGDIGVWSTLVESIFDSSKSAFSIALNLTGILCFWLGLLKIAEESGLTVFFAKALAPLFRKIFPEVPSNNPAMSSIIMNMAANVLGLDNAATPMGIRAFEQLQELNLKKDTASNAQILFMVINSSAVTLVPINILLYRSELGATNPTAVFLPILLATSISTLVGFLVVAWRQRLDIFNKVVLSYVVGFLLFIATTAIYFEQLDAAKKIKLSEAFGNGILFFIVIIFIISGLLKKQNVYENFIKGAKEGFEVAIKIIPYLVSMLVAIAVLRSSGVLEFVISGFERFFMFFGFNTDFVPALPTAILKPLSGSGARAMMIETMQTYGANSFPAFVSSVVQGSTETTFYVLAVYFGAIRVTKIRYALSCALLADFAGISSAIYFSYLFFS